MGVLAWGGLGFRAWDFGFRVSGFRAEPYGLADDTAEAPPSGPNAPPHPRPQHSEALESLKALQPKTEDLTMTKVQKDVQSPMPSSPEIQACKVNSKL